MKVITGVKLRRLKMQKNKLGKTNLEVSKLCFGSLTIGPLQCNLSVEEGANVIVTALQSGINFVDTAELYRTYSYIKEAIRIFGNKPIISTKSYAYDRKTAKQSFEKARKEMNIDEIDIFLLHEQESEHTLRGHREALEFYLEQKEKGKIKAVGISTHHVAAVSAASKLPEIDVIHPIFNYTGIGICDGTVEDMQIALEAAKAVGKGIFTMKPLGGGNLIRNYEESIGFLLEKPFIHSVAMGMQTQEEVLMNVKRFSNEKIPKEIIEKVQSKTRKLQIQTWCEGCKLCIPACAQGALRMEENKAVVDSQKCILCGYCGAKCPNFCIKII